MKKRIMSVLLLALMGVSVFAGCSEESSTESTDSSSDSSESSTELTTGTISVISRESGSGTRDAFVELTGVLVEDDDGNSTDETYSEAITLSSTEGVISNISGDTLAIGYISLGSLSDSVKAVSIDDVEPSVETVADGTYAISRPFNIAISQDGISDAAQDFINYIFSAEGQAVIEENGYVQIDDSAEAYTQSDAEGTVTIEGSSSVSAVMTKLKEAYEEINSNVTIELQTTDSSSGMTAASEGRCDIGMASRDLKDSELESLTSMTIANDGIVVIVNNDNTTDNLTMEQVRQIFTGEITDWSDIA